MSGRSFADYTYRKKLRTEFAGEVYRASAPAGDEVRILHVSAELSALDGFGDALLEHGTSLASFSHMNAVATHRVGRAPDGSLVVVTEPVVGGVSLDDLLRDAGDGGLPQDMAAAIGFSFLQGLAAAHALGCAHGAVRPGCVVVDVDGVVKLTDFALSYALAHAASAHPKNPLFVGISDYLAPEMKHGRKQPTRTADVYSAASVVFQMLSGSLPPGTLDISPGFERMIQRALDGELSRRYSDAGELFENFAEALEDDNWLRASDTELATYVMEAQSRIQGSLDEPGAAAALDSQTEDLLSLIGDGDAGPPAGEPARGQVGRRIADSELDPPTEVDARLTDFQRRDPISELIALTGDSAPPELPDLSVGLDPGGENLSGLEPAPAPAPSPAPVLPLPPDIDSGVLSSVLDEAAQEVGVDDAVVAEIGAGQSDESAAMAAIAGLAGLDGPGGDGEVGVDRGLDDAASPPARVPADAQPTAAAAPDPIATVPEPIAAAAVPEPIPAVPEPIAAAAVPEPIAAAAPPEPNRAAAPEPERAGPVRSTAAPDVDPLEAAVLELSGSGKGFVSRLIWTLVVVAGIGALAFVIYNQTGLRKEADRRSERIEARNQEALAQHRRDAPEPGKIEVTSKEDGAAVWMLLGRTPLDTTKFAASTLHELRIELDGHKTRDVRVGKVNWSGSGDDLQAEVRVSLTPGADDKPVPAYPPEPDESALRGLPGGSGYIHVETEPAGAQVWLLVGITPEVDIDVMAGQDYEFKVLKNGFLPSYVAIRSKDWLVARKGNFLSRDVALTKKGKR